MGFQHLAEQLIEYSYNEGEKQINLESLMRAYFKHEDIRMNKKLGIYKAIVYSDILKLQKRYEFEYIGENSVKDSRKYLALKLNSKREAKKYS